MPFGIAAGVGAASGLANGLLGFFGSQNAASAQENAANQAINLEQSQYNDTKGNVQPYINAGTNALTALQTALGIGTPGVSGPQNPQSFYASPGYQFALGQGQNALTNQASATGGVGGGNAMKALSQYTTGLAGQNFNQYLSSLSGVAGSGLSAASILGGLGANSTALQGGQTIGAGNANTAGIMGGYNALGGGLNSIGSNALLYALNQGQSAQPGSIGAGYDTSNYQPNGLLTPQALPSNPGAGVPSYQSGQVQVGGYY